MQHPVWAPYRDMQYRTRQYQSLWSGKRWSRHCAKCIELTAVQARAQSQKVAQQATSGPQTRTVCGTARLGGLVAQSVAIARQCWRRRLVGNGACGGREIAAASGHITLYIYSMSYYRQVKHHAAFTSQSSSSRTIASRAEYTIHRLSYQVRKVIKSQDGRRVSFIIITGTTTAGHWHQASTPTYRCLTDSCWTLTDRRLFWNWTISSGQSRYRKRTQIWTDREVIPSLLDSLSRSSVNGYGLLANARTRTFSWPWSAVHVISLCASLEGKKHKRTPLSGRLEVEVVLAELGSVHVCRQASQDRSAWHLSGRMRTGREVWQAMCPLREGWAAVRGGHGHGGGTGGRWGPDWHPQTLNRRDGGLLRSSVRVKSGKRDGRVQGRKRDCPRPWSGISWGHGGEC